MVTESLIRKKFVHETLQKGLLKIYTTQESVVRSNYQLRSRRLITLLSKHSFESSITSDSHTILSAFFLTSASSTWHIAETIAYPSSNAVTLLFIIA